MRNSLKTVKRRMFAQCTACHGDNSVGGRRALSRGCPLFMISPRTLADRTPTRISAAKFVWSKTASNTGKDWSAFLCWRICLLFSEMFIYNRFSNILNAALHWGLGKDGTEKQAIEKLLYQIIIQPVMEVIWALAELKEQLEIGRCLCCFHEEEANM